MQASARRNSELSLLILALVLGGGSLALVVLARNADLLTTAGPFIGLLAACYIGAHVAMRKLAPQGDHLVLPLTAVLNALGLAAVYRLAPDDYGPTQMTWTLVGVLFFIGTLFAVRDYRVLARYKYILGFLGLGLLMLPATPLGQEINGAKLWLDLGPFSFQPGEIAKICLVVFFAAYLAERKELLAIATRHIWRVHIPDIKHFGPLLVMWSFSLAIMFFEKDLGSSLLFFSIFLVMLYVATARVAYMLFGITMFLAGAYVGFVTFSHVQERLQIWLDVFDPKLIGDEGYQLAQSLFALATGGLFGTGLGQGRPDLIPAAHTDFVFAVIGEELGLLGTAAIVLCFMFLITRGFRVALTARSDFGQLLAAGLTTSFGVQTFIILGGVTRLLPLTGITLPFMSYGGSSLISNFILMALLVRVSDQTTSQPAPAHTAEILVGGRS